MATEDQSREYRRRIAEILQEQDFRWVVLQAEAEIAAGKAVTREVTETEFFLPTEETGFARLKPRRRKSRLLSSEPYSEAEKLEILLRGFEAAIVQRAELEKAVLKGLGDIQAIEFIPDLPPADAERLDEVRHRLDRSVDAERNDLETRTRENLSRWRGGTSEHA